MLTQALTNVLKALRYSKFSIRLYQNQVVPIKVINYPMYQQKRSFSKKIQIENKIHSALEYQKKVRNYWNDLRQYTSGVDLDNYSENDAFGLSSHDGEYDGEISQLKDFLYGQSFNDDILQKIISCKSEEEVLSIIEKNVDSFDQHHAVLSVAKLWFCKKIKFQRTTVKADKDDLKTNKSFHCLLQKILQYSGQMTLDELSVLFLYLTKFVVNMQTDVMTTILKLIQEVIQNDQSANIPLKALSRFTVAVYLNTQLYPYLVCQDVLPHIYYYLERVNDSVDFRLITICMNNIHKIISYNSLGLYKEKLDELLTSGKLNDDSKTIFKILHFLSFPRWSQNHSVHIRKLLLQLEDKIENFEVSELKFMSSVFQLHFEPSSVGSALMKHAHARLEETPTAELLTGTMLASIQVTPDKRKKLTKFAKDFIFSTNKQDNATMSTLFKIIRLLKISNVRVCDEYWTRVQNEIMNNPSEQESYILGRHCRSYIYLNNNLNGTYRHVKFEKTMVNLIVDDFENGITTLLPSKFAKMAPFILGYGHTTPQDKVMLSEYVVQRIEAMAEQFTMLDCFQLTRGIQIALQMRFKQNIHPQLASQILRLESVLNACTERHLEQPDLSLNDLNLIMRSYSNRKSSKRTSIFNKIIHKYETIPHHPLTSRIIRDTTFSLNFAKYAMPSLCESLCGYVMENKEYVVGDTVQKLLFCFYNLNYYPKNEEIFECVTKIIHRDFNYMSGRAIVEACLSLDFYKQLTANLVERVFNIEFIQRLEDEIEMCYSKAIYPQRVLNSVMQLNRAVCLDCPELSVPWFQQNYIEAQMTKIPTVKNKFFNDVKTMLTDFTKDDSLIKYDHVTPYGYKIDFVLYFDKNKRLLKPPSIDDTVHQINKVAILLLDSDSFCENDDNHMCGKESLKERHLEIMGYKVVQISYSQWNSMYLNLPGAKIDYLKKLLQLA